MTNLRVRNFDGFEDLSVVNVDYIKANESFSVYYGTEQIARINTRYPNGDLTITLEVFNKDKYLENIEQINAIIALI